MNRTDRKRQIQQKIQDLIYSIPEQQMEAEDKKQAAAYAYERLSEMKSQLRELRKQLEEGSS